jgi:uncharacterized protein (DUF885 family)
MSDQSTQQDPNEVFKQLLEALQQTQSANAELKAELASLKKELPQLIDGKINELAEETKNAFVKIGSVIVELQKPQVQLAPPTTPEHPLMAVFKTVGGMVDKAMAGPASGSVLSDMDMEILKQAKQIQVISLRNAFRALTKDSGIAEAAAHTVVEP